MNKFVLVPDSFKGTVGSSQICDIMKSEIQKVYPKAHIVSIPVADGGEGSVECFLRALGGKRITRAVKGPFFEDMTASYGLLDGDKTAVIEMAACAGLPLVSGRADPRATTTYGVGELILDAALRGVSRIVVGLGGSATNDGGCGAAAAAGVLFTDKKGQSFVPTGGTLKDIASVSVGERSPLLKGIEILTMCDIDNPMHGPNGAAYVFGPQKGAGADSVRLLDEGIMHLSEVIRRDLGKDLANVPGTGAAGAMGAGMIAFFDSRLQMGIDTVLDIVRFEELAAGADMILTGEGKIDGQSLRGKVVIGVARRAKPLGIPVVAVVGDIGDDAEAAYGEGVTAIFSTNRVAVDFSAAKERAKSDLAKTVRNLALFISGMGL